MTQRVVCSCLALVLITLTGASCGDDGGGGTPDSGTSTPDASTPDAGNNTDANSPTDGGADAPGANLGFFITSTGLDGANLGGLAGADAHCQQLAAAVGAGNRTWRAYLSQSEAPGQEVVNARDRIGSGPWFNADGAMIAADVAELHGDNNLNKATALTESGQVVNGRGDSPNEHDIITGSTADGMAFTDGEDHTCSNWTSTDAAGSARVGHHDRDGGGQDPTSWNSAHDSNGCSKANLQGTGGNGYFYCFAAD